MATMNGNMDILVSGGAGRSMTVQESEAIAPPVPLPGKMGE